MKYLDVPASTRERRILTSALGVTPGVRRSMMFEQETFPILSDGEPESRADGSESDRCAGKTPGRCPHLANVTIVETFNTREELLAWLKARLTAIALIANETDEVVEFASRSDTSLFQAWELVRAQAELAHTSLEHLYSDGPPQHRSGVGFLKVGTRLQTVARRIDPDVWDDSWADPDRGDAARE